MKQKNTIKDYIPRYFSTVTQRYFKNWVAESPFRNRSRAKTRYLGNLRWVHHEHIKDILLLQEIQYSREYDIPYAGHQNPLLIINCSWILTVHKIRIFRKKLLKKTFLAFKNGVKSIQTVGYNGARTVDKIIILSVKSKSRKVEFIQIALLGTRTIEDIQIL